MSAIKRGEPNKGSKRSPAGKTRRPAPGAFLSRLGGDLEIFPEPVLILDDRAVVIHRNAPAVASLGFDPLGWAQADLFDRTAARFSDNHEMTKEESIVSRALRGEIVSSVFGTFVNARGAEQMSRATAAPIRIGQAIVGAILQWHDMAGRKEKELAAEEKTLASRGLADMGTLAAVVAHELRNPLGVMRAALYNIRKKSTNPEIEKHVTNIEKKVEESTEIINSLLNYARIKAPAYQTVRLGAVLGASVASARLRFAGKKVRVRRDLTPIGALTIEADPDQLGEVFVNILTNAFEAVAPQSGTIIVKARPSGDDTVEIGVEDNGGGIEAADLGRLFEPFFTRKPKGTGLGLPISHRIVQLHGGSMRIESAPGAGTRVTVRLPISRK
jgi:signal transduction histidine kinase